MSRILALLERSYPVALIAGVAVFLIALLSFGLMLIGIATGLAGIATIGMQVGTAAMGIALILTAIGAALAAAMIVLDRYR